MRVNQVVIVPAFSGHRDFGRFYAGYSEYDAIRNYLEPLCEYLDEDRIKFHVQKPEDPLFPNSLIILCSIGWDDSPGKLKANYGSVGYAQSTSRKLGEFFLEAISEWGKSYLDHAHKTKENTKCKDFAVRIDQTIGVKLQPYCINGPKYQEYISRSETLGKLLAQSIYEFMMAREEVTFLPSMYQAR